MCSVFYTYKMINTDLGWLCPPPPARPHTSVVGADPTLGFTSGNSIMKRCTPLTFFTKLYSDKAEMHQPTVPD